MNLRQMEHLIALAECGSFTGAAQRVHLTQPALSRSIQALEDELQGLLFDRIGKRCEPTPLGVAVLQRARRIVQEADELQRSAELLQRGEQGVIRVGLGSGPGALLATPLLAHVASSFPGVRVSIARGSTELQVQRLRERSLDALVVAVSRVAPQPDLQIEPLGLLRGGFICRAGHPLAERRGLQIADLLRFPVATTPLGDEVVAALVECYGPEAHPGRMAALSCDDINSLLGAVLASDAVFFGIVAAAFDGIAAGQLVELHMACPLTLGARIGYVSLAGRTEAPVMRLLRRFVEQRLTACGIVPAVGQGPGLG